MNDSIKALEALLKDATPAQMETALKEIIKLLSPQSKNHEVEWEPNCPEWADNGNIDDIWASGQDNGETFMSHSIEGTILNALTKG